MKRYRVMRAFEWHLQDGVKIGDIRVAKDDDDSDMVGLAYEGVSRHPIVYFMRHQVEEITDTSSRATSDESSPTLTLRDQFAMAALTGILADPDERPVSHQTPAEFRDATAQFAFQMADAMLAARDAKEARDAN